MKKVLMTAMKASISEVMETMFFLPVEFGKEQPFTQCDFTQNISARLLFSGDIAGLLIMAAPKKIVMEMAENFMGEPQNNISEEMIQGTLTEMLNMVCGNALSKIKSKVPFNLCIPEIIDESKIPGNELFTLIETIESQMAFFLKLDR